MATIKSTMTTTQMNKYLKKYRDITFETGVYTLKKPLIVYSNTKIQCEDGVIFNRAHEGRMLQLSVDSRTTAYNGTHDVTWIGGTFVASTAKSNGIVIVICHSKNITFENVTVDGCVGLHSFEINSSQNVVINNCVIKNQTITEDKDHKEGIQIDFCYKGGLFITDATAESPCYDDTHCDNITIKNCVFENCPNGIGTHTVCVTEAYHNNINIDNCNFKNIKKNAIRLLGMKNVKITACEGNKLVIDKTKKGHHSIGGKVTLENYRYNADVNIKNCVFTEIIMK